MRREAKQTEQKEVGRIAISDAQELVATIIDDEKLDSRIFVKTDSYTGATKRGIRFYLFDQNWEQFLKLVEKIDKVYEKL